MMEEAFLLPILFLSSESAAAVQAFAAVVSAFIAAGALVYAAISLGQLKRQAEASSSLTIETFRPIIEVQGATRTLPPRLSEINF
ncbi:MAG TPA: hypothetical protein VMU24_10305, partial [Candidatus Acidoferrales bacterium]|nr:hypothetical protein [Candidatus Acidoferrales bacterium]